MNAELELLKVISNITMRRLNSIPNENLSRIQVEAKELMNEFVDMLNRDLYKVDISEIKDMQERVQALLQRMALDKTLHTIAAQN
jgi:hypothetical protein